jgi:hypothetical protein
MVRNKTNPNKVLYTLSSLVPHMEPEPYNEKNGSRLQCSLML